MITPSTAGWLNTNPGTERPIFVVERLANSSQSLFVPPNPREVIFVARKTKAWIFLASAVLALPPVVRDVVSALERYRVGRVDQ